MSIQQPATRRPTTPIIIDHEPLAVAQRPGPSPEASRPAAPPPAGPWRREDDFDVLKMAPAHYDHIDRLYRNIVLVIFAVGMVAGFWFKS